MEFRIRTLPDNPIYGYIYDVKKWTAHRGTQGYQSWRGALITGC